MVFKLMLVATLVALASHCTAQNSTAPGDEPAPTMGPEPIGPNDPRRQYIGPWFQQQVALSLAIGLPSFIAFSFLRRKYTALYAPRTKLKGLFSPAMEVYTAAQDNKLRHVFAWLLPTLKIKELEVIHDLGIDAIVLLDFLKMGFQILLILSLWACVVMMPVNWFQNGSVDGVAPSEDGISHGNGSDPQIAMNLSPLFLKKDKDGQLPPIGPLPVPSAPAQATLYHATHFISTYLISLVVIRAIYRNYLRFVKCRQLYSLEILQAIPSRTIEVRHLPPHLREEPNLAEYFEAMGYGVESVAIAQDVKGLGKLLNERAQALFNLEKAWAKYLGNPTMTSGSYDADALSAAIYRRGQALSGRNQSARQRSGTDDDPERRPLLAEEDEQDATRSFAPRIEKPRPQLRAQSWNPFSAKKDTLDEMACRFEEANAAVHLYRADKTAARGATRVGFVTFHEARSAQILAQTTHYRLPGFCRTSLAPEPRDIIWSNVSMAAGERRTRQVIVSAFVFLVLIFYIPPLTALASFLKPEAIQKYAPWLYRLLIAEPRLAALVLNFLPSIVLISFNAILPMVFEWTAYFQGIRARSLVEYSVLKKYYLFLLVSVVFIFLITSTAWEVLTELANNPMSLLEKLSNALPSARKFSLSYVVVQSLGIVPLQLLQLPIIFMRGIRRMSTSTPREHAELNAPPQLYIGTVYPQALIIFTMSVLYSIVSPAILLFGCIYFGVTYIVTKYKILFIFYKSYESKGEAWPLSAARCMWSIVLFQVFQLSLFVVRKQALYALLLVPLIITTVYMERYFDQSFDPFTHFVSLSSIAEATRTRDAAAGSTGRARAQDDDTLFVAEADKHTDYREPPVSDYYPGVLNTGRRRYGHPAVTGVLPELWLPIAAETEAHDERSGAADEESPRTRTDSTTGRRQEPLVLSLRHRKSSLLSVQRTSALRASKTSPTLPISATVDLSKSNGGSQSNLNIWSDGISGPQGSSNAASAGEVLAGDEAVAPSRQLDIPREEEEDDDSAVEGVYMHRSSVIRR